MAKKKAAAPPRRGGTIITRNTAASHYQAAKGVKATARLLEAIQVAEPTTLGEMVDRMKRDYQVRLADITLQANVQAARVDWVAESDDPRADAMTDYINTLWKSHLIDALEFIRYGRTAFEKVWKGDDANALNYIDALLPLPFANTKMLLWTTADLEHGDCTEGDLGGFRGIRVWGDNENDFEDLPPVKAYWLAYHGTPMEPHGQSLWVDAPEEVWIERQEAIKIRKMFRKRFAVNGPTIYAPPEIIHTETGETIDVMSAVGAAFQAKVSGGAMVLTNERDSKGNRLIEVQESEAVLDMTPLNADIDGLDAEQLRAFGIPEKVVTEGQAVGSFAMVAQQMLILFAVVERILWAVVDGFRKYVAEPQAKMNFIGSKYVVKANVVPLSQRSDALIVEIVKAMFTQPKAAAILLSGSVDIVKLFKEAGVPITPTGEDLINAWIAKERANAYPTQQLGPSLPPGGGLGLGGQPTG
jgi:hypothetical protein